MNLRTHKRRHGIEGALMSKNISSALAMACRRVLALGLILQVAIGFSAATLFVPAAAFAEKASPVEAPRSKIAVAVVGSGVEPDLADNLTEVIIAKVARMGGYEIAGKEEFRSKLGVESEARALGCLGDVGCLGQAGAALGATKVLAGTIGRRNKDLLFSLALYDLAAGRQENRLFKLISGGIPALLKEVDVAAEKIFEVVPDPGNIRVESPIRGAQVYVDDGYIGMAPVRSPSLEPGKHRLRVDAEDYHGWAREVEVPSGSTLDISVSPESLVKRRTWPKVTAWTLLIGAGVAAAAGGFLAVLSQESPNGTNRRDILSDVDHKSTQATVANVLFGTAGAMALTSGVLFFAYRRDIFGGGSEIAATVSPTGQMLARLSW